MASTIDTTKPVSGSPTTLSVRDNFAAAKTEIEALQTDKANLAAPALTGSATAVNLSVSGTLNAAGVLQVGGVAVTATAAELNFVDGVTSNIQTQLNGKQPTGSYLTGNQTITLSGDATGSGTTSIVVVVADDSHAHTNTTISGLDTSKVTTGTFADARISLSSVTQHQASINAGLVDGKSISVVASLPGSPDANTIYFVTG